MDHVIVTVEERLAEWRAAEKAAVDAETRVKQLGPGTADVGIRDLARELRSRADHLLANVLRAVPMEQHPMEHGSPAGEMTGRQL
jgi:hypothetical protein